MKRKFGNLEIGLLDIHEIVNLVSSSKSASQISQALVGLELKRMFGLACRS